jgi:hypothetical protein
MRATISNLNGEQQNVLHHLSKRLKMALNPLMIICYGHQASITFKTSVFLNTGMEKRSSAVFDILIVVSDDEVLPDSSLMEIARRNSMENPTERLIILRMRDVLQNLRYKSRFFAAVFRKGILLHANKEALKLLPSPLPGTGLISKYEKRHLAITLQYAQECLDKARHDSSSGADPLLVMLLLNESAVYAARYFVGAYCGMELRGDFKKVLNFSVTIDPALAAVFPRNTREEELLFHIINLTFIDEGFFPGPAVLDILFKRISRLIAVCQKYSQKKLAELQVS